MTNLAPLLRLADTGLYKRHAQPLSLLDRAFWSRRSGRPSASSIRARMVKNPVMFCVEIVSVLTTIFFLRDLFVGGGTVIGMNALFSGQITVWLWFTVLFANFAEAVAEGRGKAQADTLRQTRTETMAKRLAERDGRAVRASPRARLKQGDSCSSRRATSSRATAT